MNRLIIVKYTFPLKKIKDLKPEANKSCFINV